MYTAETTDLAKLRAYRHELEALYAAAIARRDSARAKQIYDLRRRVIRSILVREEWEVPGQSVGDPFTVSNEAAPREELPLAFRRWAESEG